MDPRTPIFDAIRTALGRGMTNAEVARIHLLLDSLGAPVLQQGTVGVHPIPGPIAQPAWVTAGLTKLGQAEIPGPKHNPWIATTWAKLGATWFNDDETPWCGLFVAWCMQQAGIAYPAKGLFVRALEWASWGVAVNPALVPVGAVGVKTRQGGGHVFLIIGQTQDGRYWKALGGNQGNKVSIIDIRKEDTKAIRWPAAVPIPTVPVPFMKPGPVSVSEA